MLNTAIIILIGFIIFPLGIISLWLIISTMDNHIEALEEVLLEYKQTVISDISTSSFLGLPVVTTRLTQVKMLKDIL